jgi:formyl-CoA transferase
MKPLAGCLVVAVEQAVAAPYCSARLADAGARVIKVERPEGDFARNYDDTVLGQSSYFVWLNRGKESVVLDLALDDDKALLERLLVGADVFIQNLKPGALDRLGFSVARLRRSYPALICCSISGYGDAGPMAQRKAYDLLIQAESGLCSVTGAAEAPGRVGISIVDIATGAAAQAAVLEALLNRSKSGEGADIRISMFDVISDWLAVPLLQSIGGKPPARIGLAHPSIAPYGVFSASDGVRILISIQNEREWKALCCDVLRNEELLIDPRFKTNVGRVRHRAETDAAVQQVFGTLTAAALSQRLDVADIAFGTINSMERLARHPHLAMASVMTEKGAVNLPATPAMFDGDRHLLGVVPALGEHSAEIQREFREGAGP